MHDKESIKKGDKVGGLLLATQEPNFIFLFMSHQTNLITARSEESDRKLREYMKTAEERPHTLEEIANVMGVTRERVRQIEMRAIKKFRFRLEKIIAEDQCDKEAWIRLLDPTRDSELTFFE